MTNKQTNKQG